jgi:hypothetical protein
MNWQWLIDEGLITSESGYYDTGTPNSDEYQNMVEVAYLEANDAQRKRLVDELWATGEFEGNKEHWYTKRESEIKDLGNAGRHLATNYTAPTGDSGSAPSGGLAAPTGEDVSYTGNEDISHIGLPGKPEIWQNSETGMHYIVYMVPGMDPELPMMWEVPKPEDLESFFGDEGIVIDRTGNNQDFVNAGALDFGTVDEVVLRGENPYAGWESQFERERKVLPFLDDPEVAAIMASAWMEGRAPTEAELAGAKWFYEKTGGEQQWYTLLATQPETAKQLQASNRLAVTRQLEQAGVYEPSDTMINYVADKWTTGLWTDEMVNNQVSLLADPLKAGERDQGMMDSLEGKTWDTTIDNERFVGEEVRRWLGPTYGQWSDEQITDWAARIRNDPDGKDQLTNELSRQRQSVLPQYANPDLTYEDIATPWRNLAFNTWGQNIDESSDTFNQILAANDAGVSSQLLREEGLTQGVKQVEDNFMADISDSFGGVRGYAR